MLLYVRRMAKRETRKPDQYVFRAEATIRFSLRSNNNYCDKTSRGYRGVRGEKRPNSPFEFYPSRNVFPNEQQLNTTWRFPTNVVSLENRTLKRNICASFFRKILFLRRRIYITSIFFLSVYYY